MGHAEATRSGRSSGHESVVRLELDFGAFELGADECAELVRLLRQAGGGPGKAPAETSAHRLEALLERPGAPPVPRCVSEDELDAIADAGWEWLRRSGPQAVPERVLTLLDALRARHAHE